MPLPPQARRVAQLPPYLFVEVTRKINEKRARGEDVISLAIGDPDLPSAPHVISALVTSLEDVANHRYPESDGLPAFRRAVADWYKRRFGVEFDPDTEVLPTIGSKEGIAHIAWCYLEEGDIALVPDPGYPVYSVGTMLAGGESYFMPLKRETGFLPDLDAIPEDVARRAKLLWINYPNNPTAAVAELDFYQRVVEFAKKYDIVVCHDGPYTEVAFDGYKPVSFMQAEGRAGRGHRVPFAIQVVQHDGLAHRHDRRQRRGDERADANKVERGLRHFPGPCSWPGVAALEGPQDIIDHHNRVYQARRDRLIPALRKMGLEVDPPKASLYVWAKLPDGVLSGEFASRLIEESNVVVTPGRGYGEAGEGFIRCSLTVGDDALDRSD